MPTREFASGKHLLLDMHGAKDLTDTKFIESNLIHAAHVCGATVINASFHHFGENMGVTGVVMLAESHISIHTWPENQFAALDLFMCGSCDPEKAIAPLKEAFKPEKCVISCHNRGGVKAQRQVSERRLDTHASGKHSIT